MRTVEIDNKLEPQTYEEAISHPTRSQEWKRAILEEYESIIKTHTWDLVPLPPGRKAISCRWKFTHKKDENGRIVRYKARLVGRGFTQVYGVDYDETYAPVARLQTLRILLAVAAIEDLDIDQMDVVTAFLLGALKNKIYMEQSEGFVKVKRLVCLLKQSLYGLKQSAWIWNMRFTTYMKDHGFEQSNADPCVFIGAENGIILTIYVDDIWIVGKPQQVKATKHLLSSEFKMKDLEELKWCLGMAIT